MGRSSVRQIGLLLLLLLAQPALAFEYALSYEQECSYKGPSFECKNSTQRATIRQRPDGKWVGINQRGREIELDVMKQDDYLLVLNNPVYFSGSSLIHIMKKTGRFYWSEFAYSEVLKADEGHVSVGRVSLSTE
mgnify:CR=1 FL=1|jgi:hypothetical protein